MADTISYIEDYFTGNLSEEEKVKFEKRCETDPVFAEEVGFYMALRGNIRQELHRRKKKEFDAWYTDLTAQPQPATLRDKPHPLLKKLMPYLAGAVAACVLLLLGWMLFFNPPSPQVLASTYMEQHLRTLSVTMGGESDSLQLGIAAFNRKDYAAAEKVFRSLAHGQRSGPEAIKNLGILYLVTGQYEQALVAFDSLAANKSLYANPGPFYKAVTLMKRGEGKDQEQARVLLQQVVDQQLPGNQEAAQWINQLDE